MPSSGRSLSPPLSVDGSAARVDADHESARQSGVQGTPTFFLNGRALDAQRDLDGELTRLELEGNDDARRRHHLRHLPKLS